MKYRPTILNISSASSITGLMIYLLSNEEELSKEEGWGLLFVMGAIGIGALAGLIDVILQKKITDRGTLNAVGLFVALGAAGLMLCLLRSTGI